MIYTDQPASLLVDLLIDFLFVYWLIDFWGRVFYVGWPGFEESVLFVPSLNAGLQVCTMHRCLDSMSLPANIYQYSLRSGMCVICFSVFR